MRRFVGYDRYEGQEARWLLADLYQVLRLYVNFFQPSMKLVEQVLRPGQENLDNPMRSSRPYSGDGALEPAYAVIAPDDENRTYRRTRRKNRCRVPHTWRTCPDPFEGVWPDVEAALEQSPHSEAKALFVALQKSYPGKFSDGQLRTLQRRVKAWRTNFLHTQHDILPSPELIVIEPRTATLPGNTFN